MKRIVKSRLDTHVVDLYERVDDLKKEISSSKIITLNIWV